MVYKYCAVPCCTNTTATTPKKLFITIPSDPTMRQKWITLARRTALSSASRVAFCEDHFDLPNDMLNYVQYTIMGSVRKVQLRPGCLPCKFDCQVDRNKRKASTFNRPHIAEKRKRETIQKALDGEAAVSSPEKIPSTPVLSGKVSPLLAASNDLENSYPEFPIPEMEPMEVHGSHLQEVKRPLFSLDDDDASDDDYANQSSQPSQRSQQSQKNQNNSELEDEDKKMKNQSNLTNTEEKTCSTQMGSLDELCRLCARDVHETGVNVFAPENSHILSTIIQCIPITISEDDSFPKNICNTCLTTLNDVYELRARSSEAVNLFTKLLLSPSKSPECMKQEHPPSPGIKVEILSDDEIVEENETKFTIEYSDESTESETELAPREKISTVSSIRCLKCGDGFANYTKLNRHLRTHSVPGKSATRYLQRYDEFKAWAADKGETHYSQNLMLEYFTELRTKKNLKSSSLWALYSMLKSTLKSNDHLDISKYKTLLTFLKQDSSEYQPKQSRILFKDEVQKFLDEAPDSTYLLEKVIWIFGVAGALTRREIHDLTIHDVVECGESAVVTVADKKRFTLSGEHFQKYKMYRQLRHDRLETTKLFVNYPTKGTSVGRPMGINRISSVPRMIAQYLQLPHPDEYTSHCFRRSAAAFQVPGRIKWKLNDTSNAIYSYIIGNQR